MTKEPVRTAEAPSPAGGVLTGDRYRRARVPLPARTTIQSDLPGFEIEVDAILLRG